ncbi:MAG: hypothetical protein ACKVRP_08540 [Bacteroidota bacterium]
MFIGHYAVALAAKKQAPQVSLGMLVLATQLVDLLWPLFLLLGLEHVRIVPGITLVTPLDFYDYPITHSLVGAVLWSLVLGGFYYGVRKHGRAAMVVGLCVFSHWVLDLIMHRQDLPLAYGGGPYFGFGLWNSLPATLIIEFGLLIVGVVLYTRTTVAVDRVGMYAFWGFIAFIAVIYVANVFGPPPPSEQMIAVAGNASWLFVLWAYWVDKHRRTRV